MVVGFWFLFCFLEPVGLLADWCWLIMAVCLLWFCLVDDLIVAGCFVWA